MGLGSRAGSPPERTPDPHDGCPGRGAAAPVAAGPDPGVPAGPAADRGRQERGQPAHCRLVRRRWSAGFRLPRRRFRAPGGNPSPRPPGPGSQQQGRRPGANAGWPARQRTQGRPQASHDPPAPQLSCSWTIRRWPQDVPLRRVRSLASQGGRLLYPQVLRGNPRCWVMGDGRGEQAQASAPAAAGCGSTSTRISSPRLAPASSWRWSPLQNRPGSYQFVGRVRASRPIDW